MANILRPGGANFTSKLNQALSSPPVGIIKLFSTLNIFLSITASLGNALILVALRKVSSIHPSTKLFFRCLTITDLGVGLLVQPLFVAVIVSPLIKMNAHDVFYVFQLTVTLGSCLCGVSILTSAAISVDRLLALLLGLRYRHVVTLRRVRVVVICSWLISALAGAIRTQRIDTSIRGFNIIWTISLAITIFCYTTIYFKLRHQQVQLHNNVPQGPVAIGGGIPLNIARYKKSVSSILWVQLALVVCYVPLGIGHCLILSGNRVNDIVGRAMETLVFLNSSLNPILYCWKIREVRQAVRDTIRQSYCF